MGDSGGEQKVDNPRLAALKRLRSDLATDIETYRGVLGTAASDMGGKKVWTGTTASRWSDQVAHHRTRVKNLVDRLLPIIDAAIKAAPAKVTRTEARQWQEDRRWYT
jgi:hypothetical protein